jgi:hypothetical protein
MYLSVDRLRGYVQAGPGSGHPHNREQAEERSGRIYTLLSERARESTGFIHGPSENRLAVPASGIVCASQDLALLLSAVPLSGIGTSPAAG